MTDMNEVIVKADRRGRLRYTPEQKQALIEAYEASGGAGFEPVGGQEVFELLLRWSCV